MPWRQSRGGNSARSSVIAPVHAASKDARPLPPTASSLISLDPQQAVVSSLSPHRSSHPYSSIALSPDRRFAIAACKDTLQVLAIQPSGLVFLKSIPVTPHFAAPPSSATAKPQGRFSLGTDSDGSFMDAFGFGGGLHNNNTNARFATPGGSSSHRPQHPEVSSTTAVVVITDVAWSNNYYEGDDRYNKIETSSSMIAASGSNGVIAVWNAAALLQDVRHYKQGNVGRNRTDDNKSASASSSKTSTSKARQQQTCISSSSVVVLPEVVLSEHTRAVNRLAWHPKLPLLLSASQDATVLLWERLQQQPTEDTSASSTALVTNQSHGYAATQPEHGLQRWFGNKLSLRPTSDPASQRLHVWNRRNKYEPKCEAVRDIQWSPFYDDVFALVTSSGSLIAYNRHVPPRALVKLTAHSGEAITLDWHPRRANVVATGGASDRCVKVWDLEAFLNLDGTSSASHNANTVTSIGTDDSSETDRSSMSLSVGHATSQPSFSFRPLSSPSSNVNTLNSASRHKASTIPKAMLHVLSISASLTRLRWRPPSNIFVMPNPQTDHDSEQLAAEDLHDPMLAVATIPIKGASAGGAGFLALWSIHRPYMPLSVVQGHTEGAVTDFEWLETPQPEPVTENPRSDGAASGLLSSGSAPFAGSSTLDGKRTGPSYRGSREIESSILMNGDYPSYRAVSAGNHRLGSGSLPQMPDGLSCDNVEGGGSDEIRPDIWQHVISVGRDSRCLVQSFVRGDRPISRVPPSCFAMANLSPFQKGYGSLQLFSVSQKLPLDRNSDFCLTGLRRDSTTSIAPGMFQELQTDDTDDAGPVPSFRKTTTNFFRRFPESTPELLFTVVDQGDLDDTSTPIQAGGDQPITVAPEVVHLSRFAAQYQFYLSDEHPTRVSICLHNADIAERLRRSELAHLWRMVAMMLENSGIDALPDMLDAANGSPANVMSFVMLPAIRDVLRDRADDGDVQSCVALCEVLQIVKPDQTLRLPDLDISIVREWYISYIDLLRDMCLFSHASYVIRNSNDPFIAALNQLSTTVHEACPRCGKPLTADGASNDVGGPVRRICKSCSRRVGLCFLCHEPVKGVYVWCPGCGHGGHLEHALQWFGGLTGKAVREVCPTGCGHKCNLLQQLLSFPRTESLKEFGVTESALLDTLPPGFVSAISP